MALKEEKINQIKERSEYFQDILEKIPSWIIRWGNTLIFLIFLLLCAGLALIEYPRVIKGNVKVFSSNPPVDVYSRAEGIIDSVYKDDQEWVEKGEWILQLKNVADNNEIDELFKFMRSINDLENFISIKKKEIPNLYNLGTLQSDFSVFKNTINKLQNFEKISPKDYQNKLNLNNLSQLLSIRSQVTRRIEILKNELKLHKKNFERYKHLNMKGVVSDSEFEQKNIDYLKIKSTLQGLNEELFDINIQISNSKSQKINFEYLQESERFNLKIQVYESYNNLLMNIENWKQKYIISATVSGKLNFYNVITEQFFIKKDDKIFAINNNIGENVYAIIKIPVINSGQLKKGQKCLLKIHNYPYQEYGMLEGNVHSYSSVTNDDKFLVKIHLPDQLLTSTGYIFQNRELKGSGEIIIGDYTAFERLFYFINKI